MVINYSERKLPFTQDVPVLLWLTKEIVQLLYYHIVNLPFSTTNKW